MNYNLKILNFARILNKVTWVIFLSSLRKAPKINPAVSNQWKSFLYQMFINRGCKLNKSWDAFLFVVLSQWPCNNVVLEREVFWQSLCSNLPTHPINYQDTFQVTHNTINIYQLVTICLGPLTSQENQYEAKSYKILQLGICSW